MFGTKQISLNKSIPISPLIYGVLIGLAVFVFITTKNILLFLLLVALCVIIRICSGKLRINDGDVVYIFGLPGSGKSMMLTKIANDNKDRNIVVNEELDHIKIPHTLVTKQDLRDYSFGSKEKGGLILWDEASLNGFDNRNFKTNFQGTAGEELLCAFKKCRHRYTGIVIANQGYNEVDVKIRSGLCKYAYWVINRGLYSVAVRLRKSIEINELTGEPQDTYLRPSFIERLITPSCYIYIPHRKYAKMYNTINDNTPYYFTSEKYITFTEEQKKKYDVRDEQ